MECVIFYTLGARDPIRTPLEQDRFGQLLVKLHSLLMTLGRRQLHVPAITEWYQRGCDARSAALAYLTKH
jgi:hypothetical protein